MREKILVLDLVHGGDIISERFLAEGNDVWCSDIYGISTEEKKEGLRKKGIGISTEPISGDYDLVVLPVHCPDRFLEGVRYRERMTFHEAVGRFMDDERFRIEITGVKGKTSLCYLLAHTLSISGKRVFLHTSRGQGPWVDGRHKIEKLMSIAPTSMLVLPEGDYDVILAESSLGGSGKADIAVITNLAEDYGIAEDTRKASDAKASVFSKEGINVVAKEEIGIWEPYGAFRFALCGQRVNPRGKMELGKPVMLDLDYRGPHSVALKPVYLAAQYLKSMDLLLEICEIMDIPIDCVMEGLETFEGVPGRGEISFDGMWVLTERNPGISHVSIRNTLECLRGIEALDGAVAIIDPVNRKVCEKLRMEKISEVFEEYGVPYFLMADPDEAIDIPDGTKLILDFIKEGYQ